MSSCSLFLVGGWGRGSGFDHGEDVFLAHDDEFLAVQLDLVPAVLLEKDRVVDHTVSKKKHLKQKGEPYQP